MMFGFLRKRRTDGSYRPRERMLFTYFDGQRDRVCDPMVIYKRIMEKAGSLSTNIRVATSISKDAPEKHGELIKNIRDIFQIKPLEEGGLTEVETAELMDAFFEYIEGLKKNTSPSLTSRREALPPSPPLPGAGRPMPNTSDTGSTETDQPTSEPAPSPSV